MHKISRFVNLTKVDEGILSDWRRCLVVSLFYGVIFNLRHKDMLRKEWTSDVELLALIDFNRLINVNDVGVID